jgi:hypothetical protein
VDREQNVRVWFGKARFIPWGWEIIPPEELELLKNNGRIQVGKINFDIKGITNETSPGYWERRYYIIRKSKEVVESKDKNNSRRSDAKKEQGSGTVLQQMS